MKSLFLPLFVLSLTACHNLSPGYVFLAKSGTHEWTGTIKNVDGPMRTGQLLENAKTRGYLSSKQKSVLDFWKSLLLVEESGNGFVPYHHKFKEGEAVVIEGRMDHLTHPDKQGVTTVTEVIVVERVIR